MYSRVASNSEIQENPALALEVAEEISKLYPTHPGVVGFKVLPEMIHGEILQHRKHYFIIEDWLSNPFVWDVEWMPENGLYKEL